jgi:hypothetical protein
LALLLGQDAGDPIQHLICLNRFRRAGSPRLSRASQRDALYIATVAALSTVVMDEISDYGGKIRHRWKREERAVSKEPEKDILGHVLCIEGRQAGDQTNLLDARISLENPVWGIRTGSSASSFPR